MTISSTMTASRLLALDVRVPLAGRVSEKISVQP